MKLRRRVAGLGGRGRQSRRPCLHRLSQGLNGSLLAIVNLSFRRGGVHRRGLGLEKWGYWLGARGSGDGLDLPRLGKRRPYILC